MEFFDDFNELGFNKSFEMVQQVGTPFCQLICQLSKGGRTCNGAREKRFSRVPEAVM